MMSRVTVKLVDGEGDPIVGSEVTLWWKGPLMGETSSTEYTDSDGEAVFDYSTENWSGDRLAIYVEGAEFMDYHSPDSYYEFTVD